MTAGLGSSSFANTAFVFPGQGSQFIGMVTDIAAHYPAAAHTLERADQILGVPFARLLAEGPAAELDDTLNTQPALYVASIATLRAIESNHGLPMPVGAAGHSVGELSALTAANALPFEDGLKLVRERARLMKEAGAAHPGAMAALLGPTVAEAEALCLETATETGLPIVVANDNCPGQVVISGADGAIDRALVLAKERGIKRAVKLSVSVAAHSPLMSGAAEGFRAALAATPFSPPHYPVISNATAQPLHTVQQIRDALGMQLNSPVHWTACVQALRALGATTFLELGPKDVLTGLLKRIDREATGLAVNSAAAVAAL